MCFSMETRKTRWSATRRTTMFLFDVSQPMQNNFVFATQWDQVWPPVTQSGNWCTGWVLRIPWFSMNQMIIYSWLRQQIVHIIYFLVPRKKYPLHQFSRCMIHYWTQECVVRVFQILADHCECLKFASGLPGWLFWKLNIAEVFGSSTLSKAAVPMPPGAPGKFCTHILILHVPCPHNGCCKTPRCLIRHGMQPCKRCSMHSSLFATLLSSCYHLQCFPSPFSTCFFLLVFVRKPTELVWSKTT